MALPFLRYRVWLSKRKNLRRLLDRLVTTWDAGWVGFMGRVCEACRSTSAPRHLPPTRNYAS